MDLPKIIYSQTHTAVEWSILDVITRNENGREIVTQLNWSLLGTRLDNTNSPVSALKSGTVILNYNPDNFIEFSDLTDHKFVNWINTTLGVDKTNELCKQLNVEVELLLQNHV